MHILLSSVVAEQYAADIRAIAGQDCQLVALHGAVVPDADELAKVDVAFLSADMFGKSSKSHLNEKMAAFSDAVAAAPALRWLHTCSAGTDRPVLQQAMQRGVTLTTSSGANAQAVAHTAIAGLLALARGVPLWVESQARHEWATRRDGLAPRDIDGTHALVIGMGPIGMAIAQICRALGMRVSGVRRDARPHADFDAVFPFDRIAEATQAAQPVDWVILACPLTPITQGLVDQAFIDRLPATARLVNVARGEIVVEAVLQKALNDDRLAGYYSDVFVEEPLPPDSPWWTTRNTLVSAHSAAASTGFAERTVRMFLKNMEQYVQDRPLANVAALA